MSIDERKSRVRVTVTKAATWYIFGGSATKEQSMVAPIQKSRKSPKKSDIDHPLAPDGSPLSAISAS